jgi:hypothetical protein
MDDSPTSPASTGSLNETIVTLPRPVVIALAVLLGVGVVACLWLAIVAHAESVREVAKSVLLVLLPLSVVVAAAIGIRRTSTTQVDQLVMAFVEQTVLSRFKLACRHPHSFHNFPFHDVVLAVPTHGRSYAAFDFQWADPARRGELARVWVKMNVVNFEVMLDQRIAWPGERPMSGVLPSAFFDHGNLEELLKHPIAQKIAMTLQGSIEEGYKIRMLLQAEPDGGVTLKLSFRQKLREHFLASPFLRRYYAEDAAILVGVLFHEMAECGLLAAPHAAGT